MIVNPDLYEKNRVVINREKFLRVEGVLQNQDHTISIEGFPSATRSPSPQRRRNPTIFSSSVSLLIDESMMSGYRGSASLLAIGTHLNSWDAG